MTWLDLFVVLALLANYLIAVPAFLSADSVPLILLGIALGIAPAMLVFQRFFKKE